MDQVGITRKGGSRIALVFGGRDDKKQGEGRKARFLGDPAFA